jgi:hypothetical protein
MQRSSLEPVVLYAEIALRDRQVVGGQRGGPNGIAPGWALATVDNRTRCPYFSLR